jgi:hypothetical protein
MDITMIGLQNAGKTSLLRVLAVGSLLLLPPPVDLRRRVRVWLRPGGPVAGVRV